MRKTITALTATALIASLAACDIDGSLVADGTYTPTTVAATAPDTETETISHDEVFLTVIARHGIPRGDAAIDAAKAACEALDSGNSAEQVALIALDGFDGDTDKAGALLGAGAAAYCPQHLDALTNLGQGSGA